MEEEGPSSCLSMLVRVLASLGTWPSSGPSLGLPEDRCRRFWRGRGGPFRQAAGCEASLLPSSLFLFPSQKSLMELVIEPNGVQMLMQGPGSPPGEVLPLPPQRPQAFHCPRSLGSDQSPSLLGPCRAGTSEASQYSGDIR